MRADSPDGHGLWIGDTRHLSDYRLRLNGEAPVARAVRLESGSLCLLGVVAGLQVERERYVDGGLHERITITNPGPSAVAADLELTLESDFADMMALRGCVPGPQGSARPRETEIVIRPSGTKHRVALGPGENFTLIIDVVTQNEFDIGLARTREAYKSWAKDCATFQTDNPAVNELLERSRDDLRMLLEFYPTGPYPTGGMPWYAVPFGRDALWTLLFMLPTNPDVARGSLRFLAAHQGRRRDPAREEQPGKILHEVRTGEAVECGLWPHILYGTVDATPLYICALAETVDWTADQALLDELWRSAEEALRWCQTDGDPDRDGYIECYTGRGRNQGWKDSDDSLTHVDGTNAAGQAALCEVQGYLYRALLVMARKRPELNARAAALWRRFNRDFWIPRESYIAQGLDRVKRRVEAVSSNPGHCLWAGILSPETARAVAARLVAPDLFSGWGIRTLSSQAINYDPGNHANGPVCPFDSAIAAAGLRRAGFVEEAELVARSVLEAGVAFSDRRLPEVWRGTDRVADRPPEALPESCSPQSWSAAAPFSLLSTLLGLEAKAEQGRLRIAPCPTPLWTRLEVHGLHFAGHRLDFAVDGDRVKLGAVPPGITIDTDG